MGCCFGADSGDSDDARRGGGAQGGGSQPGGHGGAASAGGGGGGGGAPAAHAQSQATASNILLIDPARAVERFRRHADAPTYYQSAQVFQLSVRTHSDAGTQPSQDAASLQCARPPGRLDAFLAVLREMESASTEGSEASWSDVVASHAAHAGGSVWLELTCGEGADSSERFQLELDSSVRRRALLVSCEYPNSVQWQGRPVPEVGGCHDERRAFESYLRHCGWSDIRVLGDEPGQTRPTRKELLRQMSWLIGGGSGDDALVFFFAGVTLRIEGSPDRMIVAGGQEVTSADMQYFVDEVARQGCAFVTIIDGGSPGVVLDLPYAVEVSGAPRPADSVMAVPVAAVSASALRSPTSPPHVPQDGHPAFADTGGDKRPVLAPPERSGQVDSSKFEQGAAELQAELREIEEQRERDRIANEKRHQEEQERKLAHDLQQASLIREQHEVRTEQLRRERDALLAELARLRGSGSSGARTSGSITSGTSSQKHVHADVDKTDEERELEEHISGLQQEVEEERSRLSGISGPKGSGPGCGGGGPEEEAHEPIDATAAIPEVTTEDEDKCKDSGGPEQEQVAEQMGQDAAEPDPAEAPADPAPDE
eukprot:TRINITY_DN8970_c0_g1_i1.p1 TRINITY_DN8970_c0_g1~~TRINITY_DN8970_c0_g1_i1.p1  ORF type:complete len:630 (+),score=165.79 TRINITY_DN8970_c0_g1_i1:102-1892(+)